jgi:hypothetical protein
MIGREECAARSAESAAIWSEPPTDDTRGGCISFGIAGVDISCSQPFVGMTCRQAYATPQSVCHLPIEQLIKNIRNEKNRVSDLIILVVCRLRNKTFTKLSPNSDFCRIIPKTRASRIG